MEKQKICIVGGSLTGLVTAISLSKLNCKIDLVIGENSKKQKFGGTIAISENNLEFIKKLNFFNSFKKEIWPCKIIKLYSELKGKSFTKIFELKESSNKKSLLYMVENNKIKKLMIDKIKKIKSISLKKNERIQEITNHGLLKKIKFKKNYSKYNLVIICTGGDSQLVKNIFSNNFINNSYNESSITTILKHNSLENNIARQIFLDDEIFAMLPISDSKTAIVWSIGNKKKNNFIFKKKIKSYAKKYLNNIKFINKIQQKNLNFSIRNKYYKDRILLFGDALHVIHPFAGQGFNMTLRDLKVLEKVLRRYINLGLDVGSSNILSEFSNKAKPANFAFSLGTDILKNSFSIKNQYFKIVRNEVIKSLSNNSFAKNIFAGIANRGLKF